MNKQITMIASLAALLILAGCGNQTMQISDSLSGEVSTGISQSFVVGDNGSTSENVYGLVIADDTQTITSNVGGTLSYLDCQPGDTVSTNTVIAKIIPNENDPSIENLRIQKESLQQQLQNLRETYDMTSENFDIQKSNVETQTNDAQDSIQESLDNFKNQQQVVINDAFKKINSNSSKTKNTDLYDDLYDDRDEIENMSDDDFSYYLQDMSDLMTKAAKHASGDTLYNMFIGLANTFRSSKSVRDTLVSKYESANNDYTQDDQYQAIENNKEIQLNALENQIQTIEQTLDTLSSTLQGETLYAGINGVIKSKTINEGNKVNPNTPICNIISSSSSNLKLQIYSSFPIKLGQIVKLYNGDTVLGAAKVQYELPYKDPATQNYIYEITNLNIKQKDGDRVTVQISRKLDDTKIRIPIQYVTPELDGSFVNLQTGNGIVKTEIQMGDINGGFVEIIKGLKRGDEIVN